MKRKGIESPEFDVAIIGGGPAGSSAATFLARAGKRVVVLEKERFPRFHIGESLLPYNMRIFDEMGVREAIDAAGFMPKTGARFMLADGNKGVSVEFKSGAFTEETSSWQVDRSKFDEILLRHAGRSGAEVREGTRVSGYEMLRDRVSIETSSEEVSGGQVQARWLIDASGMSNFTGNRAKLRVDHPSLKKLALFSHYEGAEIPKSRNPGDIIIVRLQSGWCWIIPLSESLVSLGIVVDRGLPTSRGMNSEALINAVIEEHPCLRNSFRMARRVRPVCAVTDYSYMNREFVSDRLIRVGDAAGFLDPIFSSGVYLAMLTGRNAALALGHVLEGGRFPRSCMRLRAYERSTRQSMNLYRKMIEQFYTSEFIEIFLEPSDFLGIPAAVNALLAGRLDNPWKLRWRLAVFYAIVRLQRTFPLAPRLKLS